MATASGTSATATADSGTQATTVSLTPACHHPQRVAWTARQRWHSPQCPPTDGGRDCMPPTVALTPMPTHIRWYTNENDNNKVKPRQCTLLTLRTCRGLRSLAWNKPSARTAPTASLESTRSSWHRKCTAIPHKRTNHLFCLHATCSACTNATYRWRTGTAPAAWVHRTAPSKVTKVYLDIITLYPHEECKGRWGT